MVFKVLGYATFLTRSCRSSLTYLGYGISLRWGFRWRSTHWDMLLVWREDFCGWRDVEICHLFSVKLHLVIDVLRYVTCLARSFRLWLTYWDKLFLWCEIVDGGRRIEMLLVYRELVDGGRRIEICYLFDVKLKMVVDILRYAINWREVLDCGRGIEICCLFDMKL